MIIHFEVGARRLHCIFFLFIAASLQCLDHFFLHIVNILLLVFQSAIRMVDLHLDEL